LGELLLENLSKNFDTVAAVKEVSLSIHDGEFVVLLGPSGCGKTTTLRMIAGLEEITGGKIYLDGRLLNDVLPGDRDIAMVFQNYALYPHMTVYKNMAFGLRMRKTPRQEIVGRVKRAADILAISHLLERYPRELSGGQRQRVAVGRAIVRDPRAFLFDEPLSNLDAKLRVQTRVELLKLHRQLAATSVYVTHDQIEAMTMADRIGVMNEGALIQLGTPREIYERPNSAYVAGRLGMPSINLIPAELLGIDVGSQVRTVGLRTEHIRISRADRLGPRAEVHWVEHLGDQNHVHLKLAAHSLVTLADPVQQLKAGDQVSIEFTEPLYFDAAGNRVGAGGFRGQA
jgi:multiple sugar transport system ATP-binding protein